MAKDFRREIAEINLKAKGFRTDAMFYCLSALQFFKDKTPEQVKQVAFEIGMKGRQGLDINNPDKKYTLNSMRGSFTGLQLVSYMYVGFKMIDPKLDIGLDLSEEYKQALKLLSKKGLMDIQFIDPVPAVLEEVKSITGKGIEFIQKENLPTYAALKMARKNMPSHLIYYKKEHDEIINHLIVHECGHLFRIFKCPENQRLMPYSNQRIKYNALKKIENEIIALTKILSEDQIAQIIDLWYNGLIRQVTNLPPDIMIEKWIYDNFLRLRPLQLKSLKKQHSESVAGLTETVRRMTPHTIFLHQT